MEHITHAQCLLPDPPIRRLGVGGNQEVGKGREKGDGTEAEALTEDRKPGKHFPNRYITVTPALPPCSWETFGKRLSHSEPQFSLLQLMRDAHA